MNTQILQKIGLTEGEIKVYNALAYLGKAATGKIINKSGISSSKSYIILEKLIKKGLVSFIVENNVKKFQIANPNNIIEYISKQQQELESVKKESESFVKELNHILGSYEEESAQIYKGFAGMRVAFANLLYYKSKDKVNGFLLGVFIVVVGIVLDMIITVPLFIIPADGSYATYFSGIYLILGLIEGVLVVGAYDLARKK